MTPGAEDHAVAPALGVGWPHRPQARRSAALLHGLLALGSAAAGLGLAWHYPLLPPLAIALFVGFALLFLARPGLWLVVVPALLPLIGFAPWTGWLTFEEWDLLVLAAASGGYARLVFSALAHRRGGVAQGPGAPLVWLLVAALAAWQLAAMARGFADAGGLAFGWHQGYREPMNSLRLGKSLFAALLLYPLWAAAQVRDPARSASGLAWGLSLGLLGTALATLWERAAFTDLINFSTDYRTTALFWEMHVGGAALDGWLALTLPFALRELLVAQPRWRMGVLAVTVAAAAYACLTTFSRGVYLALPIGLALMLALQARQRSRGQPQALRDLLRASLIGAVLVAALAVAAALIFPDSGYRGLLALLGAAAVLLALPQALRAGPRAHWVIGIIAGALLSAASWGLADLIPKGPYLLYAAATGLAAAMLALRHWQGPQAAGGIAPAVALAGFVWMLSGLVLVASHWGGPAALATALPVALVLLAGLAAAGASPLALWPASRRWQALTAGAMLLAGAVVATFIGGGYMSGRFSTSSGDLDGRLQHWRHGLGMLHGSSELLLGKGMGRYVDHYAIAAPPGSRPGDYRLQHDADGKHLRLIAGTHMMGWGELLRIAQRVALPQGPVTVGVEVRADKPAILHFEVCQKHLLYDGGCLVKQLRVAAKPGQWQALQAPLDGPQLVPGPWYAPKLVSFSFGTEDPGWTTAVRKLSLTDGSGRQLLANGDFSQGLARWFFTSDRYHMPWHMKNMALHLVFDQGLLGLAGVALLSAAALLRTTVGPGRQHALAPGIAGGVVALAVVGLFDSLLDVPRLAFLFYFLLLLGATLRAPPAVAPATGGLAAAGSPAIR